VTDRAVQPEAPTLDALREVRERMTAAAAGARFGYHEAMQCVEVVEASARAASQERPQPDHEGYIDEFGDQRQAIEREAAAPAVDVERLAEAAGNVLDGRRIGSVRLYRNTITPDDWSAITDEYDRLGGVK
jgi:hypothetical protein